LALILHSDKKEPIFEGSGAVCMAFVRFLLKEELRSGNFKSPFRELHRNSRDSDKNMQSRMVIDAILATVADGG
jgi:hypothetical protein